MTAGELPQPTPRTARARLDASTQLPIADLSPSQFDPDAHILAQVALVWPYSSSTGTLALLLADPDIRRRKSNGQVKAVFRNGCAKEVATSKVGIGDTVRLALDGCEWKETGDVVSTPGKKINWDLEYKARVLLEILRSGQETATVDFTRKEADASTSNGADIQPKLNGATHHQSSTILVPYLTPRKSVGNHLTETFIDAALDSLAEDDGYVLGRGRKRTKFARSSGAWSLVDLEDESHPEEAGEIDWDGEDTAQVQSPRAEDVDLAPSPAARHEEDQKTPQTATEISKEVEHQSPPGQTVEANTGDRSSSVPLAESTPPPPVTEPLVMGPPRTPIKAPLLQPATNAMDGIDASDSSEAATTPRLLPIPSPGLPLVSPLIHRSGVQIGYFPPLDTSISQLDASSERQTRVAVLGTDAADPTDRPLLHSNDSPVVVEISPSEEADESLGAKLDAHADSVLASHEPQVAPENREPAEKPAYEAPQWLSSLESTIDQELLLSQDQPAAHILSQHTTRAVEVEDDDLYGAPADIPDAAPSVATLPPVARPRSPLDVLEQFLQISPTTAAGFSNPLESDGWQNASNAIQQDASEDLAVKPPQFPENLALSTNSNRSPGRYPEPQSPFRRNRHNQESPVKSTHSLSTPASRSQSLDGHVDERESFGEYINRLAQLSANTETSKQLVPNAEPSHNDIQSEVGLETHASVTVKVDGEAHVESSGYALEGVERTTHQSTATDELQEELRHLPAATSDELKPTSTRLEHVHTHELHAQLPTPDQSQVQRSSSEPETPKPVRESTEVGFLSPRYTQEEIDDDSQQPALPMREEMPQVTNEDMVEVVPSTVGLAGQTEGADAGQTSPSQPAQKESPAEKGSPAQLIRASMSPTTTSPISAFQPDTLTPYRSPQQLSADQSTMAANVSSLHFTLSKSSRPISSSPPRKENVDPARDDSAFLSLPTEEQAEAPPVSNTIHESERAYFDIYSVSPDLKPDGSVPSRDTGTRTSYSYFSDLRSLHRQFGQLVDVIAVCADASSEPEQSKAGRKDYHTALKLTDPSIASETHSAMSAQVFRPVRTALPTTRRGDVVILRNFKVQTFNRQFMLSSTDASSWAMFEPKVGANTTWSEVIISGPPLEYGAAETELVRVLFSWWNKSGQKMIDAEPIPQTALLEAENGSPNIHRHSPRLKRTPQLSHKAMPSSRRQKAGTSDEFGNEDDELETVRSPTAGANPSVNNEAANSRDRNEIAPQLANTTDSIPQDGETTNVFVRPSNRRRANETDHSGNDGDEDGVLVDDDWEQSVPLSDRSNRRRASTISTAPSESGRPFTPRRSARFRKSPSLVHELRDGTKYVDDDRRRSGSVVHQLRDGVTYVDE